MEYGNGSSFVELRNTPDAEHELKKANIYYAGKFLFVGILCFILYNTGSTWLGKIISTIYHSDHEIGASLVARTTSSLAIWFVIHAIIMICNPNLVDSCQFMIHISWKSIHSLLYFALWIGFWFIPDSFFDFYMKFAIYVSGIYLVIQVIFLVDFFHILNDKFVQDDNLKIIAVITGILSIGSIVGFGLEFYFFGRNDGCNGNNAIIAVHLILCFIIFIAAAKIEHGSIFTASLICAYTSYLTCSSLMCDTNCNSIKNTSSSGIAFSVIASIFTITWTGYSAFSTTNQFESCSCSDTQEKPFSLSFFHSVFALACVYLTMIVTHWGDQSQAAWTTERGIVAKWINLAACWLTYLLYIWTLIAPLIFPDRDFTYTRS